MGLFDSLFRALNEGEVRYLVVGGVATVLHGYPRVTLDVDLMVDLVEHPLPFEDVWNRSVVFEVRGQRIRTISMDDLIELKKLAGRPQDFADIEALASLKEERAKRP
jgi:hypothetical protein